MSTEYPTSNVQAPYDYPMEPRGDAVTETASTPPTASAGEPEPEPIRADEPVVLTPVDPTPVQDGPSAGDAPDSGASSTGDAPPEPASAPKTMAAATMGDDPDSPISSDTVHEGVLVRLRDVYMHVENWAARHPEIARFLAADLKSSLSTSERINDAGSAPVSLLRRPMDHQTAQAFAQINRKLDKLSEQQQDINAATAALTALTTDVAANVTQLGTDITAIQAALAALPASVDTTALDAAVAAAQNTAASLDASVQQVTALAPPPAAPPAS